MISVLLHCWFYRIEFYPFTAMQMFSSVDTSGVVPYTKVLAHRESGAISPARFTDDINARYGRVLRQCIGQMQLKDVDICKKFLQTTASAHNKKARPGEKITKYEIQIWKWDFRSNPSDPNYGNLTKRLFFEITTGGEALEKGT